jgi:hypothetical protein
MLSIGRIDVMDLHPHIPVSLHPRSMLYRSTSLSFAALFLHQPETCARLVVVFALAK